MPTKDACTLAGFSRQFTDPDPFPLLTNAARRSPYPHGDTLRSMNAYPHLRPTISPTSTCLHLILVSWDTTRRFFETDPIVAKCNERCKYTRLNLPPKVLKNSRRDRESIVPSEVNRPGEQRPCVVDILHGSFTILTPTKSVESIVEFSQERMQFAQPSDNKFR